MEILAAVATVGTMPPGRMGPLLLRSRSILEAEAGAFARWGLAPGSTARLAPAAR